MTETEARTARLAWVQESDPRWDADRERVFATVPEGVFRADARTPGEQLSGDWWRVVDGERVVGYGWLDDVWGDAEILLAVEESARGTGAGAFALGRLEDEAVARGLNYVVNVVRDTHPDRAAVTEWFLAHGFTRTEDGAMWKCVGDRTRGIGQTAQGTAAAGHPATGKAELPDEAHRARYAAARERAAAHPYTDDAPAGGSDLGPGHEESGGYVDPEHHRF